MDIRRWLIFAAALCLLIVPLGGCASHAADTPPAAEPQMGSSLAATDEFVDVAENGRFSLAVRPDSGQFRLFDQQAGQTWFSNPPEAEEDTSLKGIAKTNLFSAVQMTVSGKADNEEPQNSYAGSAVKHNVQVSRLENGFRALFYFATEEIRIYVDVLLTEDGLTIEIPDGGLREEGDYRIFTLSLYPYFGVGGADDTGYAVLPDGMGALMHFNNGKSSYPVYKQALYGGDISFAATQKSTVTQQAYLPMFGIRKNQGAFAAVCERGAEYGYANAFVSGQMGHYNGAYFSFSLRNIYQYTIDGINDIRQYEKDDILCEGIRVRYLFAADTENADYTGIAALLREYAKKTLSLSEREATLSAGLVVPGMTTISESLFGVGESSVVLTDYQQLASMLERLQKNGMTSAFVTYQEATKSEKANKVANGVQPMNELGGKSAFASLFSLENVLVAPEVSLNLFENSGNGINYFRDTVRNLSNAQAQQQTFRASTFYADKDTSVRYLVTVQKLAQRTDLLVQKTNENYRKSVALMFFASAIYGDYHKNDRVSREAYVKVVTETLASISEGFSNVSASGANLYALAYLTQVTDMPLVSSDYMLLDETIPLLSMVYGGFADLYSTSINLASNPNEALLACLEYGVSPSFTLFADTDAHIPETNGQAYFACRFSAVEQDVLQFWETWTSARQTLSGRLIGHRILAEGVSVAQYETGTILINRSNVDMHTDYGSIKANSYLLIREEG